MPRGADPHEASLSSRPGRRHVPCRPGHRQRRGLRAGDVPRDRLGRGGRHPGLRRRRPCRPADLRRASTSARKRPPRPRASTARTATGTTPSRATATAPATSTPTSGPTPPAWPPPPVPCRPAWPRSRRRPRVPRACHHRLRRRADRPRRRPGRGPGPRPRGRPHARHQPRGLRLLRRPLRVPGRGGGDPRRLDPGRASSAEIDRLVEVIRDTGVPAIFAETSSPTALAEALAEEADDVEVVTLFTESLGDEGSGGATYLEMMRTDAERIAEALT